MSSMNSVFLMGNLTRDPESRTTPAGATVTDLGMAINETYKDKDDKPVEKKVFVDVVVWGRQAETCAQYLKKGAPVMVEGRLQLDQWENEKGEKRSKMRVRAVRVQFLGRPPKGEQATGEPQKAAVTHGDDEDTPF